MALRDVWIPLFLLACLVLGGASNGGFLANGVLQALGAALIVCSLWRPPASPLAPRARLLGWLMIAASIVVLLQFLPLPQAVWELPAGRKELAAEGATIGIVHWPLLWGLLPFEALKSAVWLLPAIALVLAMLRRSEWQPQHLAWVIVAAMVMSVILGAVQLGQGRGSPAYFYAITNFGSTVGFYANSNHLATLLLVSLPFVAALIAHQLKAGREEFNMPFIVIGIGLAGLALSGIVVNGSLAGWSLVGPVMAASGVILVPRSSLRKASLILLPLVLVGGMSWMLLTEEGSQLLEFEELGSANGGRPNIWSNTAQAIGDHLPLGSGLGTFTEVYPRYEDPATIESAYINHAHNEYLELLLELGLAGLVFFVVFLVWWSRNFARVWLNEAASPFAVAGAIASCTILIHSVVDYPLRTAAVSGIFAVSLCLMVLCPVRASRSQHYATQPPLS
jgi:O-antigen ligase